MAKIEEKYIIVKMSKLVKDDVTSPSFIVGDDVVESLAAIIDEVISDDSIITEVSLGE